MQSRIIEASPNNQTPPMFPEVGVTLTTRREYKHILPDVLGYLKEDLVQIGAERAARQDAPVSGWRWFRGLTYAVRAREDAADQARYYQVLDRIAEVDTFLGDVQSQAQPVAHRSFDLTPAEANAVGDYMGIDNPRLPPDVRIMRLALATEVIATRGQEYSRLFIEAETAQRLGAAVLEVTD